MFQSLMNQGITSCGSDPAVQNANAATVSIPYESGNYKLKIDKIADKVSDALFQSLMNQGITS